MCSWDGVTLQQVGYQGTQLPPEDLCPGAVAAPKGGGEDVQGLSDLRGSCGTQARFYMVHNLLGTCRPGVAL